MATRTDTVDDRVPGRGQPVSIEVHESLGAAIDAALVARADGRACAVHRLTATAADRWAVAAAHRRAEAVVAIVPPGDVVLTREAAEESVGQLPAPFVIELLGRHRLADLLAPESIAAMVEPDRVGLMRLCSLDSVAHNLPFVLTSFVGRSEAIAQIAQRVTDQRLVTVTGAGGCGKTRTTLHAAAQLATGYDSVTFVDLSSISDPDDFEPLLLRSFAGADGAPSLDVLARRLSNGTHLLLVDNCEHMVSLCAQIIETLTASAGGLRVLATSREPLGVIGEAVVHLPPMSLTPADLQPEDEMSTSDAVDLFIERARLVRPEFGVRGGSLPAVTEICRRLDGIPLAIEMAAAHVRTMAPSDILDGLTDRFRTLMGGAYRSLGRHQTLQASVDWSYRLLGERACQVLDRLSVFAGWFDASSAEVIIEGAPIDSYEVLPLLAELVDRSLVVAHTSVSPTMYHLLESVKQFASERLAESGSSGEFRQRHAMHFANLAEQAAIGMDNESPDRWLSRVDLDLANLSAGFDWFVEGGQVVAARAMCGALTLYWSGTGRLKQARSWYRRSAACGEPGDRDQLRTMWGEAYLDVYAGDLAAGVDGAERTLEFASVAGDLKHAARALGTIATVRLVTHPTLALDSASRAARLAQEVGDRWCEVDASQIAAYTCAHLRDPNAALSWLDRALPLARRIDNPQLLAWDLLGRASVAEQCGSPAVALGFLVQAEGLLDRTRDQNIHGLVAAAQVQNRTLMGDFDGCLELVGGALSRSIEDGAWFATLGLTVALARFQLSMGDAAGCLDTCDANLHLFETVGPTRGGDLLVLAAAATLAITPQRLDEATARISAARERAERSGGTASVAVTDVGLAAVSFAAGNVDAARRVLERAVPVLAAHALLPELISAGRLLAAAMSHQGKDEDAARLFGAADACAAEHYLAADLWAFLSTEARRGTELKLPPARLAELHTEGSVADFVELVCHLTRGSGRTKRPTSGWGSLTPTERRVVELIREGRSNRDIGRKMFVTPGTVKTHLAHIYAKLQVANRTELAAASVSHDSGTSTS